MEDLLTHPPYSRALHPDDYQDPWLAPHVEKLAAFERKCSTLGVGYRKDHQHRAWEYANLLAILQDLEIPHDSYVHDSGSGNSYLPLYLKSELGFEHVSVSDSMAYGDIEAQLIDQCLKLGIEIPLYRSSVERLNVEAVDAPFDVTICVSTIEHVDPSQYLNALRALIRITKPGGLIYLTSDYFQSVEQADRSIFRGIQHNLFTPEYTNTFIDTLRTESARPPVRFIGGTDFTYRGDHVNTYSFVSLVLQKDEDA